MDALLDLPFPLRLGLLALFFLALALWDRWRHGAAATRPREVIFLLAVGALGALVGCAIDHITSRLSPEYFVLGKGLDPDPEGWAWRVSALGLHAGFVAGLIAGGALLVAASRPGEGGAPGRAARALPWPLLCALAGVLPGALVARACDPVGLRADLAGLVDPPILERFLLVWGLHAGLYAGAAAGTLAGCWRLRRAGSSLPPRAS